MSDDWVSSSATFRSKSTASNRPSRLSKLTSKSGNVSTLAKAPWRACVAMVTKIKKLRRKSEWSEHSDWTQRRHSSNELPPNPLAIVSRSDLFDMDKSDKESLNWKPHLSLPTVPVPSALSPPPRHARRECMRVSAIAALGDSRGSQPRPSPVTPKRLSLDAEQARASSLYNSPSIVSYDSDSDLPRHDEDTLSIQTGLSALSNTDPAVSQPQRVAPYRSGTLGDLSVKHEPSNLPKVPPLPADLPKSQTIPNRDTSDTGGDVYTTLSLKERRRRRSPLSIPADDHLTLAIRDSARSSVYSDTSRTDSSKNGASLKDARYHTHTKTNHSSISEEHMHSRHIHQSRQDAMCALEGKATRTVRMTPIANMSEIDGILDRDGPQAMVDIPPGLERDKAQYDAVVAMHRRPCSPQTHNEATCQYFMGPRNGQSEKVGLYTQSADVRNLSLHSNIVTPRSATLEHHPPAPAGAAARFHVPVTPPSSSHQSQPLSPFMHTPSLVFYPSSPSSLDTVAG